MPAVPAIEVSDLVVRYPGGPTAVDGLSFSAELGEVVALLGRNGAGKTTTLKSVIGIFGKRSGSITFDGVETIRMPSRLIAWFGMAYVPE